MKARQFPQQGQPSNWLNSTITITITIIVSIRVTDMGGRNMAKG
jgi:hypothetical protein